MRLLSLHAGQPETLQGYAGPFRTAIRKRAVDGPVRVEPLGLEGDAVGDTESHGGPDQALLAFGVGNYAAWVAELGPKVEHHEAFPRRVNAHFVKVHSPNEVTMRTWERGSGITLACGTGACAVCVAGVLTGRTDRRLLAHLPGGDLRLHWSDSDNHVYKTGPATEVFTGEWPD